MKPRNLARIEKGFLRFIPKRSRWTCWNDASARLAIAVEQHEHVQTVGKWVIGEECFTMRSRWFQRETGFDDDSRIETTQSRVVSGQPREK